MTQKSINDPKDLTIKIVNVVASVTLNQKFNLLDIVKNFRNVEYNPKRFPGLVFRLKRPKTATLIFSTGKMVCTGATSEKMARRAVNKVVRELKDNGIIILNKPKIVIQNMVASGNLHGAIDLETAADVLENVMYEPEQFPGLIYRMQDPVLRARRWFMNLLLKSMKFCRIMISCLMNRNSHRNRSCIESMSHTRAQSKCPGTNFSILTTLFTFRLPLNTEYFGTG